MVSIETAVVSTDTMVQWKSDSSTAVISPHLRDGSSHQLIKEVNAS
jgi:hypothetical protein